jgi:hypothetical protein
MKILTNTFDYQIGYYPFSIRKMIYYNPLNLLLVSTDNTCFDINNKILVTTVYRPPIPILATSRKFGSERAPSRKFILPWRAKLD